MKITLLFGLCLLVIGFSACVKKQPEPTAAAPAPSGLVAKSPEEVVKYFIEISASAKEDEARQRLRELCQGEMRMVFDKMTPEAFKIAYVKNNLKLKDMKIVEQKAEGEKAHVVYEVSIDNPGGTDPTSETNQREVELVLVQGAWYIDSIRPRGSDKIAFTRGMVF